MRSSKLRRCKIGHCLRPSRDRDACSEHAWTNADARNTPQILRLLATFRIGQVEHTIGQAITWACSALMRSNIGCCTLSSDARPRLRLCERERIERERCTMERSIRFARFPVTQSLDTVDVMAMPSLNKALVLEWVRCEWIDKRENGIALAPSGVGKTHTALARG